MPCGRHIDVVVSTAVSHQGGPKFESTSQRRPFCVEFGCSPYAYMGPKSMETSYEIYPLVQKPLTVSSKSTVWVTLQILWNASEMRGVCGCPSRSLSKRKLKGRSLNLEAAVHSFWQFAPERQLKCSQFVVHVKKKSTWHSFTVKQTVTRLLADFCQFSWKQHDECLPAAAVRKC